MGITYGECTWKKFRITPDWKCVDFRINTKYSPEEQREIWQKIHAKDHYDVCKWCRYFSRGDHTGQIPE